MKFKKLKKKIIKKHNITNQFVIDFMDEEFFVFMLNNNSGKLMEFLDVSDLKEFRDLLEDENVIKSEN